MGGAEVRVAMIPTHTVLAPPVMVITLVVAPATAVLYVGGCLVLGLGGYTPTCTALKPPVLYITVGDYGGFRGMACLHHFLTSFLKVRDSRLFILGDKWL